MHTSLATSFLGNEWLFGSFLVRGAVVLALALVVVRAARRASAAFRHAILVFALAATLVLPVLAAVVPTWHARAAAPAQVATTAVAECDGGAAATSSGGVAKAATHTASAPIPWATIAGAIWLAGVALFALRLAVGARRARKIAARGTRGDGVIVSDEIESPFVVGAFAPMIVVPRSSSEWSAERWRVVLAHEQAHVQRHDGLANLVAQVACCLQWVNPLAWLAARRARAERELAADDAVLRTGTRASTYAEHLLAIASNQAVVGVAMARRSRFEARVAALFEARARTALGARRTLGVALATIVVATVAACMSAEPAPVHATGPASPADPALQAAAEAELDRALAAHHGTGAIAVVLDARTGASLAIATRGDADARAARTPGSTMKPFTVAAALDAGAVSPDARIDCEQGVRAYGDKQLRDMSPHGELDLGSILAVSSNVGTAKLAEPLGDRLGDALRRYHFAAPAHIDTHSLEGAELSSGESIRASALDVAVGYTAFADAGTLHAPDGASERVMSADTAHAILAMLDRVVADPDGTGHAARIDGVQVAGKTGTAESTGGKHYASFVGIVPADAPRFVVLVGVDGVTGAGGDVAAPVFARIAARALGRPM